MAGVHAPPTERAQSQVGSSHITCSQMGIVGGGADWAGYRADEEEGDHMADWAGRRGMGVADWVGEGQVGIRRGRSRRCGHA